MTSPQDLFLKFIKYKLMCTQDEKDALLAELAAAYITKGDSRLMDLLLEDKFLEFNALFVHMNKEGERLKKLLMEGVDEKI